VAIGPFVVGQNRFDDLVPRCDLCLTVSGTATLHVAIHGSPLIVVYRLNPWLWHLFARWVVTTRKYSLVNLLNTEKQDIVPEFIPWYGSNKPVADKTMEYLHEPRMLSEQRERLRQLVRGLARPGASRQAAILALDLMTARDKTKLW
jgi:lipid-A-disaccharide synthase